MNWIKNAIKRFWKWLLAIIVGGVAIVNIAGIPPEKVVKNLNSTSPTYFAELASGGMVLRVIVANQAFIDSGKVGDPKNWIETTMDGSKRKNYAGKGYKYDKTLDAFIPPRPGSDWTLDINTVQWRDLNKISPIASQ